MKYKEYCDWLETNKEKFGYTKETRPKEAHILDMYWDLDDNEWKVYVAENKWLGLQEAMSKTIELVPLGTEEEKGV